MDHSRALRAVITESLEASSQPTQTVMDANHGERSECTQHRSAHGMEMSSGSWTMAMNHGSGYAPSWGLACPSWRLHSGSSSSCLQPSSWARRLAASWTINRHWYLSSIALNSCSTDNPVQDVMFDIHAVLGLPRLLEPGVVPCMISFFKGIKGDELNLTPPTDRNSSYLGHIIVASQSRPVDDYLALCIQ